MPSFSFVFEHETKGRNKNDIEGQLSVSNADVLLAFIRRLHFYSFVEPLAVFILETYNASRRIMRLQII